MPSRRHARHRPPRRLALGIGIGVALALGVAGLTKAQTPPAPAESPAVAPTGPAATSLPAGAVVKPAAATPLADMLPDNALVYGFALQGFDTEKFVAAQGGYLARYNELLDGQAVSGAAIVERVAEEASVSPKVLLALIQSASRWVTDPEPAEKGFPVGEPLPGLYTGLAAAADALNRLYYGHKLDGRRIFPVAGGAQVQLDDTNSATFATVGYLSRGVELADWGALEPASRFSVAYSQFFGDPFADQAEDITGPLPKVETALPFTPGEIWYFVLGPHSGWGVGGPRAAVDFAPPPASATGCTPSIAWVTAAAAGRVLASNGSGVLLEVPAPRFPLDGFLGTGWVHVYSHLSPVERVAKGTLVKAGERLGHPACEATAVPLTRVAFSRRFNGSWIAADDQRAPLALSGWAVLPGPEPGTGWLAKAGQPTREAGLTRDDAKNSVLAQ